MSNIPNDDDDWECADVKLDSLNLVSFIIYSQKYFRINISIEERYETKIVNSRSNFT